MNWQYLFSSTYFVCIIFTFNITQRKLDIFACTHGLRIHDSSLNLCDISFRIQYRKFFRPRDIDVPGKVIHVSIDNEVHHFSRHNLS